MNWIWIKKNQNILVTAAVLFFVVIGGIPFWLHLNEQRNQAASESYYQAVQLIKKEDPESLKSARTAFEKIISDHKSSKVARLAAFYAAHVSLKLGENDKAAGVYESLLRDLAATDPLRPLAL